MWFIYALIGAFFKAITSLLRKKIAGKIDGDVYLWISLGIFLIVLLPFAVAFDISLLNSFLDYWPYIVAAGISTNLAIYLFIRALELEDLSYIAPLNAFIPIFTLFFAWITLNEAPPAIGILGVVLVFVGVYVVNLHSKKTSWSEPIKRIFNNTGARFGIGVAISFAATTVISKGAIDRGLPAVIWLFLISTISWLMLLYVPLKKYKKLKQAISRQSALIVAVSLSSLTGAFFGFIALVDTFSSYAISVRRLDIIFAVLLGWYVLKEKNIRHKLTGSIIMTIGVVVIVIA